MSSAALSSNSNDKNQHGKKKNVKKGPKPAEAASLERKPELGMNPVSIGTGYYGTRGERIKHTVHQGALQMPREALELMDQATQQTGLSVAPSDSFSLPGLDSVLRPTRDPNLTTVLITDLSLEKVLVPSSAPPQLLPDGTPLPPRQVEVVQTKALQRTIHRPRPSEDVPTSRIRGGGPPEDPSQPFPPNPSYQPTPSTTQPPSQPVSSSVTSGTPSSVPAPVSVSVPVPAPVPTPAPIPSQAQVVSQAPPPTTSSGPTPTPATSKPPPSVPPAQPQRLPSKPDPQWEQHRPTPNDEMVTPPDQLTPKPDWYHPEKVSDLERTMLPEWFNQSAPHRTPEKYIKARETILTMSTTVANRNVTAAMVRRAVPGDAGSLQRLRDFLTDWGWINEDAINDSAPTPRMLRETPATSVWTDTLKDVLLEAVVDQSSKRRKVEGGTTSAVLVMDWEAIADKVGHNLSATDCEKAFLTMQLSTPSSSTSTPSTATIAQDSSSFLQTLVDQAPPVVMQRAIDAALDASVTGNSDSTASDTSNQLQHASSGAVVGILASQAVEQGRQADEKLAVVLAQVLDQRMKKLENRMAMMDDMEAILEAEKMALELERRDLYTARCRHWFGGT